MKKINIFLAGDSTMADYPAAESPQTGWGQLLPLFLKSEAVVHNKAANGRSSKSFIEEGRLDDIKKQIAKNDYLLVQFGHNDSKPEESRRTKPFSTYQEYLNQYIKAAEQKGAHPLLLTPIQRRRFNSNGQILQTHGKYPDAMRQLAEELDVPLIDLTKITDDYLKSLGFESSKSFFMWLAPGQSTNFPDGVQDDTHLNEEGAKAVARLAAEEISNFSFPLAHYINKEVLK
ncbi:rhamnogalacturonan acetylesterase [Halobacillus sp. Marseille-Q1614]|uniref:rhamnogalacturonan acetylesterase n=1 Tax=Halobacillus sp. Marseille-Q1614 TaxID=2709134 RepID=UPI00156D656D|nr:rhamnogalacturonan acetylesterase [Halobacillus sp. Marseille-Q1614]